MKRVPYFFLVLAILITIPLSQVVPSKAQETASLEVAVAAICSDVVDREPVARVNLAIKASSWRTYSSKRIQRHEIGDWHVDVLDPNGEVLKTLQFKIIP